VLRKAWGSRADPLLGEGAPPYNSRAIIDACRPFERIKHFPRVAQASPELLRRIESKWSSLFAQRPAPAPGVGGGAPIVTDSTAGTNGSLTDDAMAGED
jgi:hypothetical protein